MKKNKGISLIVLVITIIIIIILAGAVILNLSENNPINNAEKAKINSDIDTFQSDLTLQVGQKYIADNELDSKDIDSDESKSGWKLVDLVPSIKGTEYESYFAVRDAKLILKKNIDLDEEKKEIIMEALGISVVTSEMIKNNPSSYIGKYVTYEGYSENTNSIDWRIYNVTEDGVIQLIADSCINLDYKKSNFTNYNSYLTSSYEIGWWTRDDYFNDLSDTTKWTEFAIAGCSVKGATTIEEFINSYDMYYDSNVELSFQSDRGASGYKVEGEVLSDNDLYLVETTDNINRFYINGKPYSEPSNRYVYAFGYNGESNKLHQKEVQSGACGIRPVVSLVSAELINNNGTFQVQ